MLCNFISRQRMPKNRAFSAVSGKEGKEVDAVKELIFDNDPYGMNWLREDFAYGEVKCPKQLCGEVKNRREGDTVYTEVTISNPGKKPYFTDKTSISIAFPLVDKYESSKVCMEQRCHTHIFCGGQISYICALRMGGQAPHLGMVLTKGSLAGYSIERNLVSQSNDRGCFLLHPSPMEIKAGESVTLEWIIFSHEGMFEHSLQTPDFFRKLAQYHPHFVKVWADRYVLFPGERNTLRICPAFTAEKVTVDGQALPEADGIYQLEYTAQETGEKIFEIQADGVKTWCRTYVQERVEELAKKRCLFVAGHQQYHGGIDTLQGAYLAYDNEEEMCIYRPENDYNGGRERIGMGVLMTRYLSGRSGEEIFLLRDSLDEYREYVLRELVDAETGKVYNDMGRDDSYKRLYNAPWAATFFTEQYRLRKDVQELLCAYRIVKRFYEEGGKDFYPIDLPILLLDRELAGAGMETEREELLALYREHADRMCERDICYPASEVNYEQSIVAPAADILLSVYVLTGDAKYLKAAERQIRILELFNGMQPDYHLHEVAVRHWDGYWFGKKRYFGDTFPHYWSALTGNVFELYGRITGNSAYLERAENSRRAVLTMFFADGRASCAYLYPFQINGREGEFYDAYANDQDWGLYFYLKANGGE